MKTEISRGSRFELRFEARLPSGRCYAFPCDAQGHVALDALSERELSNYLFARAVIGRELQSPRIVETAC